MHTVSKHIASFTVKWPFFSVLHRSGGIHDQHTYKQTFFYTYSSKHITLKNWANKSSSLILQVLNKYYSVSNTHFYPYFTRTCTIYVSLDKVGQGRKNSIKNTAFYMSFDAMRECWPLWWNVKRSTFKAWCREEVMTIWRGHVKCVRGWD